MCCLIKPQKYAVGPCTEYFSILLLFCSNMGSSHHSSIIIISESLLWSRTCESSMIAYLLSKYDSLSYLLSNFQKKMYCRFLQGYIYQISSLLSLAIATEFEPKIAMKKS